MSQLAEEQDIAGLVAHIFKEIREDMDSIVSSADMESLASAIAELTREEEAAAALAATPAAQQACQQPALLCSDDFPPLSAASAGASPALQLHGRTEAEEPGYYDCPLPEPVSKLPEALAGEEEGDSAATAPAAAALALSRCQATGGSGASAAAAADDAPAEHSPSSKDESPGVPAAAGPCRVLTIDSTSDEAESPVPTDDQGATAAAAAAAAKAEDGAGGMSAAAGSADPKGLTWQTSRLQPTCATSLAELLSSPRGAGAAARAAKQQFSSDGSGAGPEAAAPATGSHWGTTSDEHESAAAAGALSNLTYSELLERALGVLGPRQARQLRAEAVPRISSSSSSSRKAALRPASARQPPASRAAATSPDRMRRSGNASTAVPGSSSRIFKSQSLLSAAAAVRASEEAGGSSRQSAVQTWHRSRSAPREVAAAARHVQRLNSGPHSSATCQQQQQQQQVQPEQSSSNPKELRAAIERLYRTGVEKQAKRVHAVQRRSVSPVRLTEGEWKRVTQRLFLEAQLKDERMRARRLDSDWAVDEATTATCPSAAAAAEQRLRDMAAGAAAAGGRSSGGGALSTAGSAFHQRQQALLNKRREWANQKKAVDEEEQSECTFRPQINRSSQVLTRSIGTLQAWDNTRKAHVERLNRDKSGHEFDGHTFMPVINNTSRRMALASYAAAPDPARPWTSSPTHTRAPDIRQYTPPRAARREQEQRLTMSGPDQDSRASASREPSPAAQQVRSAPAGVRPAQADAATLAKQLQFGGSPAHSRAQAKWPGSAAAAPGAAGPLPPGTVLGVPVAMPVTAGPPVLPDDAVVIQMPEHAGLTSPTKGPLLPVAAGGDGVAFISIGAGMRPIRTAVRAPEATAGAVPAGPDGEAAATAAAAGGGGSAGPGTPVLRGMMSPGQAQAGLEEGRPAINKTFSGAWQTALTATAASDRSASEPAGSAQATSAARVAAGDEPVAGGGRPARPKVFRDDSAASTRMGGCYGKAALTAAFVPVSSAQKASLSKLSKQLPAGKADSGADEDCQVLQPTLSGATRAALDLAQKAASGGHNSGMAVAPACYLGSSMPPALTSSSGGYSQIHSKAAVAGGQQGRKPAAYSAVQWLHALERSSSAGSSSQPPTPQTHSQAGADSIMGSGLHPQISDDLSWTGSSEQQQPQIGSFFAQPAGSNADTTAGPAQGYAQQYAAAGGAAGVAAEALLQAIAASTDACTAGGPLPGVDSLADMDGAACYSSSPAVQRGAGIASLAGSTNGQQQQQQLTQRQEGLLEQTQSVPYELQVSPRSRLYLSSDAFSPLAQQLLAVLSKAEEGRVQAARGGSFNASSGSSFSSDAAASPTHNLVHSLLRPVAGSPFLPDSAASSRVGSSHNLLPQQRLGAVAAAAATSKLSAGSSSQQSRDAGDSAGTLASTADRAAAPPAPPPATAEAAGDDEDEPVTAADLAALLFDPLITPEDKARRVARAFSKGSGSQKQL